MDIFEILYDIPCPVFWKSKEGKFLGVNKAFLIMTGYYSLEQVVGKTDLELSWSNMKQEYSHDDQMVMKTGKIITRVETVTLHDGSTIISETTKTPLLQNGNIIGVLDICIDITSKLEAEQLKIENAKQKVYLEANKKMVNCLNEIQHLVQNFKMKVLKDKLKEYNIDEGIVEKKIDSSIKIKLTKREREILYFLSLNKTPKEISVILSGFENKRLASSTISSIIDKQLYIKFGVHNVGQLIEKAHALKLIPFVLNDH